MSNVKDSIAMDADSLECAIVLMAVIDYKKIVKGHLCEYSCVNMPELYQFFHSAWCDTLLIGTQLTGKKIWEYLENWREEYERSNEK